MKAWAGFFRVDNALKIINVMARITHVTPKARQRVPLYVLVESRMAMGHELS
jgi:hypothetical protein